MSRLCLESSINQLIPKVLYTVGITVGLNSSKTQSKRCCYLPMDHSGVGSKAELPIHPVTTRLN